MTVRSKLILNAAVMAAGILAVAAVSMYAVFKVKGSISVLTEKSAPLQLKMLELQQQVGKVSVEFYKLGMASDAREVSALSSSIEKRIASMEKLNEEIKAGSAGGGGIDSATFRQLHTVASSSVSKRIQEATLFHQEAGAVAEHLRQVEQGVAGTRGAVGKLGLSALRAVDTAEQANMAGNGTIKKLLTLQNRVKDTGIVIANLDEIRNRFKIGPIREKLKSTLDLVNSLQVERHDPPVLREVRDTLVETIEGVARDGGLVQLRTEILSGKEQELAEQYAAAKRSTQKTLEDLSARISNSTDQMEIQLVKDRQGATKALSFENDAAAITSLGSDIGIDVKEVNAKVRLVMLAAKQDELDRTAAELAAVQTRIVRNLGTMNRSLLHVGQKKLAGDVAGLARAMGAVQGSINKIVAAKGNVLASDVQMQTALDKMKGILLDQEQKGDAQVKELARSQEDVLAGVKHAVQLSSLLVKVIFLAAIAIIVIGIVLSWRIIASISSSLHRAETFVAKVSAGDLTERLAVHNKDEVGNVCDSLNDFVDKLHHTISGFVGRADTVAASSANLMQMSQHLSSQARSQLSEALSLSSAAEEISATVTEVAENARSASEFSSGIREAAEDGGRVIMNSIEGVKGIAASVGELSGVIDTLAANSDQIGDIVNVIRDIADQTSLLALNAAIEAARAGEQGQGFAVVAHEVKKLAEGTTVATNDIYAMIRTIQESVAQAKKAVTQSLDETEKGVGLANHAGESLENIVKGIDQATAMITQIAVAASQQSATVNSMTTGITHISGVSEQFSEGMDVAAGASSELNEAAAEVRKLAGQFRVSREPQLSPAA